MRFPSLTAAAFVSLGLASVMALANEVSPVSTGGWRLNLPLQQKVAFRGLASFDDAGLGSSAFLYPAPDAGSMIAAVLTHGLLTDASRRKQKEQLQTAADQVLTPYRSLLDEMSYLNLWHRAFAAPGSSLPGIFGREIEQLADGREETVLESAPVYFMTQDQQALIIDALVVVTRPGEQPGSAYRNSIRVVSDVQNFGDKEAAMYWLENNGAHLQAESVRLLTQSLEIVWREVNEGKSEDFPYRTVRYRQGGQERMERAQVIREQCNRLLLRTLRGNLMSVPIAARSGAGVAESCRATVAAAK